MSVKINIHPFLTQHTNNQDVVEVNGSTVGQCLSQLIAQFPGLRQWLFEKNGKLNRLVEIYVNMKSSYPEELAKPVRDGDELHIIIKFLEDDERAPSIQYSAYFLTGSKAKNTLFSSFIAPFTSIIIGGMSKTES